MISDTPDGGSLPDIDDLDPFDKGRRYAEELVIFVYGLLAGIKAKGSVEGGGAYQLSGKGQAIFERLRDGGFDPAPREMEWAINVIQSTELCHGTPLSNTGQP